MKKNLLSCLVASALVFSVGLGAVKNVMAEEGGVTTAEETTEAPDATTTPEATDATTTPEATDATTTPEATEGSTTTEAPSEAPSTEATTTVKPGVVVDEKSEAAKVAERESAKASGKAAVDQAAAKACDLSVAATMSDDDLNYFWSHIEAVNALVKAFDVKNVDDAAGLAKLQEEVRKLEALTSQFGTADFVGEKVPEVKSASAQYHKLLVILNKRVAAAQELYNASLLEPSESAFSNKAFQKFFGCYSLDDLKEGKHLAGLKGLREAINEAIPYATCETEADAAKLKYEIASLEAYLKVAGKCQVVVPADPKKPAAGNKGGKAAPALPATGEVATALPLVLVASASVLTALRKKH